MTTPRVTEIPLQLTPSIATRSRTGPRVGRAPTSETLERRAQLVRDVIRARADRARARPTGPLPRP